MTERVELDASVDGPLGAPALVLSNSLGTTRSIWDRQLEPFAQHFRVVRYDHRGHGRSPAPPGPYTIDSLGHDLVALLDRLGLERVHLCGLSLGGMVAMWLAAHAPERVERLVLCCTATELGPPGPWEERAALVRAQGTGVLFDALAARWFTPRYRAAHPEVVQAAGSSLAACAPEGYAACCEAIARADLRGELRDITAPTLLVCGADDPVTPPSRMVELQEAIPGAAMTVLADDAHLANLGQPERFSAAVLDHLLEPAWERGARRRAEVLGAEHVERSSAGRTALNAPFLDLITRYAWGEVWTRPGLDARTRSCITVAMLVVTGRFEELALHLRAARRNGVTIEELREVLLQTAIYGGVPSANRAFAVAAEMLGPELDAELIRVELGSPWEGPGSGAGQRRCAMIPANRRRFARVLRGRVGGGVGGFDVTPGGGAGGLQLTGGDDNVGAEAPLDVCGMGTNGGQPVRP